MRTLLLQNQQIIIQQQNMMFMMMKQFHPQMVDQATTTATVAPMASTTTAATSQLPEIIQMNHQDQFHHPQATTTAVQLTSQAHQQEQHSLQPLHTQHQHQHHNHHQHQNQQHQQEHLPQLSFTHHQINGQQRSQSTDNNHQQQHNHHHQQLQQVATPAHLQAENIATAYLTPVASEQDPISDTKPDDDDISALLGNDGLLTSNLLYNPQTDIGQITPYKNHQHQQHQQTPSYYSSGCESLTTPRVEQQQQPRQSTTANINQNVVKNLADSFKSPSKPKINVQILSGSATRNMKNNKAKIIQRMNISEFLRHVHQDDQAQQQQPLKSSATQ